jgi:hypothetical protein
MTAVAIAPNARMTARKRNNVLFMNAPPSCLLFS